MRGQVQYLIKWEGYPDSENTWEPLCNLNCDELIAQFENKPIKKTSKKTFDKPCGRPSLKPSLNNVTQKSGGKDQGISKSKNRSPLTVVFNPSTPSSRPLTRSAAKMLPVADPSLPTTSKAGETPKNTLKTKRSVSKLTSAISLCKTNPSSKKDVENYSLLVKSLKVG